MKISEEEARRITFEYIRLKCDLPDDCEVVAGEVKKTIDTGRGSDIVKDMGLATKRQIVGSSIIKQLQSL